MAVFAPMPRARVRTAMKVKPGFLPNERTAYFRSVIMPNVAGEAESRIQTAVEKKGVWKTPLLVSQGRPPTHTLAPPSDRLSWPDGLERNWLKARPHRARR